MPISNFYPLAHDNWDERELAALQEVIASRRFTMGPKVEEFEEAFANFHGRAHAVMVNSGSSANLLMLAALVEAGTLSPGDEVIVPAVSWSTTYFPVHQYGLKLVFVDVDIFGNIDINGVENAISEKTRAVFAVNLLGFSADLNVLNHICMHNNLILLEDNCESFGAKYKTDIGYNFTGIEYTEKFTGTAGCMSSFSFFFSHHLSTMEGGMILTDNSTYADMLRSLRAHGWTRGLKGNDFYQPTGIPFEDSFKFILPGYCVRPLEFSAAVGLVQLEKWPEQRKARLKNAKLFTEIFGSNSQCTIPEYTEDSTWFGLPMLLLTGKQRKKVVDCCEWKGIETRPIVAGNFVNQPVTRRLNHRVSGTLNNAEMIDKCGLFFGNDDRDLEPQLMQLRLFI